MKENNNSTGKNIGKIISLADGVCWASGLKDAMYGEMVDFGDKLYGMVLSLDEHKVGIVVLGNYEKLKTGDQVKTTEKLMGVEVSEKMVGRVVDALGQPIDEKEEFTKTNFMPVEKIAPGIIDRKPVDTPLQTGIKAIDAMIPIGRGQRELIIGDRQTGKTAIAVDTVINQKESDVISIYVSIGQKRASNADILKKFKEYGVSEKVIMVCASASDSTAMRYLAPYTGTAIAEFFLNKGKHVLVIYDDLTKHAWAYREMSLLLKKPSGREAFPGDVFYLHSRLLERSCQLSDENGGGSITALPIIETQAQDVSAYIPTNVISITDGQIYLENDLFFAGIRPALNVGLSVSRIGGAAQVKIMKKIAGRLRLDLSQYYELATFAQFATDLDKNTREKIERGKRIVEILKQKQYSPYSLESQIISIYLVTSGKLDDVPLEFIQEFENKVLVEIQDNHASLYKDILKGSEVEDKLDKQLDVIVQNLKRLYVEESTSDTEFE